MEENNTNPVQETQQGSTIDWMALFNTLLSKWKTLVLVGAITFVVVAALQLCIPNYYETTVKLSPELGSKSSGGGVAALASQLGFDLSSASGGSSAIMPSIYPDIVSAPDFAVGLFDVEVRTQDGEYVGPYYDYLTEHQKAPFWSKVMKGISKGIGAVMNFILNRENDDEETIGSAVDNGSSVLRLTKKQALVTEAIGKKISCEVDKKMGTITINVSDQDPQVCGMMADSVRTHLQNFITEYHTFKAKLDSEYFKQLMDSAKIAYDEASMKYYRYAEEHAGLTLERYKIEQQNLQMDMTFKQNIYTTFQKQYLQAEAQIQECKPAFTTIKAPAVPTKKAGPSRAKNVLMFTFLALIVASVVLVRKQIDWKALFE